ncbi:thymidine phosphorylase [Marinicella gelatinilytica]|uniref:thymidine phosphorylase n=1 Tax=Marinicella gelatinilytica TaxID=2996017 RepID=UPI002260CC91|nr:thymidine phosphorylase [Marinicella gelatinilytica]MCX7544155.1 thymidine phosphorylase [Marinicella gelatinilytica]
MLPQEIIKKKRDGHALSTAELNEFVRGITDESVTEAQIAAFAMAVYFQDMTFDECRDFTFAMQHSGDTLDWSDCDLRGPVLDKHSTGGVGDKVSLMLAPILAACGAHVPMISGRGLGHTGGTLDKLEAIPGYNTHIDVAEFKRITRQVGCSIIGQTAELAPADKRIYATRDITATVDCIPLITASILSKKLAAGLDALIMDVKCGNGAFANNPDMARALAKNIVNVSPIPTRALITDMNQVLGHSAGNAVEIRETIDYLTGDYVDARLHELVKRLAAELLIMGNIETKLDSALNKVQSVLDNGEAAEKFSFMTSVHGGPADLIDKPNSYLKPANIIEPLFAPNPGYLTASNCRDIGLTVVELGGGRRRSTDPINYSVGLTQIAPLGTKLDKQTPLCLIHAENKAGFEQAKTQLLKAITVSDENIEIGQSIISDVV